MAFVRYDGNIEIVHRQIGEPKEVFKAHLEDMMTWTSYRYAHMVFKTKEGYIFDGFTDLHKEEE